MYKILIEINNRAFNDSFIKNNLASVTLAKTFLDKIKYSWINSFVTDFVKKHDGSGVSDWQVFPNDAPKRQKLLSEIRKARKSGAFNNDYAKGMYEYVLNNSGPETILPAFNCVLTQKILLRFKPLFDLQSRILEFMCQSGYNLSNKKDDVTDYLIAANLLRGNSVFVSNETKNLVPSMHKAGQKDYVWTFAKYCSVLNI